MALLNPAETALILKMKAETDKASLKEAEKAAKKLAKEIEQLASDGRRSVKKLDQAFNRLGRSITSIGMVGGRQLMSFGKTAAIALGAVGAVAVKTGASFEFEIAKIVAISGQGEEAIADLSDEARRLGKTTMFTATQAAQGMTELAKAGLSVNSIIRTTGPILELAGATSDSMAHSVKAVVATIKQFNLGFDSTNRVVDVFAKAVTTSLLDMHSLTEAMKFGGSAGAAYTMTLEETVASLAAFRDMGLEGSLAGTNFRMSMAMASVATERKVKILKKYKLVLDDITPVNHSFADILDVIRHNSIEADDALVIFGRRSGAQMRLLADAVQFSEEALVELNAALASGEIDETQYEDFKSQLVDIRQHTKDLEDSAGSAKKMYEKMMNTVTGKAKIVFSKLEEAALILFSAIKDPLKEWLDEVMIGVDIFAGLLEANASQIGDAFTYTFNSITQVMSTAIGTGHSFIGIIIAMIMGVGDLVKWFYSMIDTLKTVAKFAAIAFALGGVTIAVTAVSNLVATVWGLVVAIRAVIVATIAAKGAMVSTGIGALVLLVGKLAAALWAAVYVTDALDESMESFTTNASRGVQAIAGSVTALRMQLAELAVKLNDAQQAEALKVDIAMGEQEVSGSEVTRDIEKGIAGAELDVQLRLLDALSQNIAAKNKMRDQNLENVRIQEEQLKLSAAAVLAARDSEAITHEQAVILSGITSKLSRSGKLSEESYTAMLKIVELTKSKVHLEGEILKIQEREKRNEKDQSALEEKLNKLRNVKKRMSESEEAQRKADIAAEEARQAALKLERKMLAITSAQAAAEAKVLEERRKQVISAINLNKEVERDPQKILHNEQMIAAIKFETQKASLEKMLNAYKKKELAAREIGGGFYEQYTENVKALQSELDELLIENTRQKAQKMGQIETKEQEKVITKALNLYKKVHDDSLSDLMAIQVEYAASMAVLRKKDVHGQQIASAEQIAMVEAYYEDKIAEAKAAEEEITAEEKKEARKRDTELYPQRLQELNSFLDEAKKYWRDYYGAITGLTTSFGGTLRKVWNELRATAVDVLSEIATHHYRSIGEWKILSSRIRENGEVWKALGKIIAESFPGFIFASLKEIFSNEDLTRAEKFQQVIVKIGDALRDLGISTILKMKKSLSSMKEWFSGLGDNIDPDSIGAKLKTGFAKAFGFLGEKVTGIMRKLTEGSGQILGKLFEGAGEKLGKILKGGVKILVDGGKAFIAVMQAASQVGSQLTGMVFGTDMKGMAGMAGGARETDKKTGEEGWEDFVSNKVDEFVAKLESMAANIGPFIFTVVDGLVVALQSLAAELPDIIGKVVMSLMSNLEPLFEALVGAIVAVITAFPDIVGLAFGIIDQLLAAVPDIVGALIESLLKILVDLPEMLTGLVIGLIDAIMGAIMAILNAEFISNLVIGLISAVQGIIIGIVEAVPIIITALLEAVPLLIEEIIMFIPKLIENLIEFIPKLIASIIGIIFDPQFITALIMLIPKIIMALIKALPQLIKALVMLIPELIRGIGEAIFDLFGGKIKDGLIEAGSKIKEGWKSWQAGMRTMLEKFGEFFKEIAEKIKGAAGKTWDFTKEFFTAGYATTDTFGDTPGVMSSRGSMVQFAPGDLFAAAKDPFDLLQQVMTNFIANGGGRPSAPSVEFGFDQLATSIMGMSDAGGAGGGGSTMTNIVVQANGEVLDQVMVNAERSGHAPQFSRMIRRSSGIRIGFDRGRFAPQSG